MGRAIPDLGDPEKVMSIALGCRPEDVAPDVIVTPFLPIKVFRRHLGDQVLELSPPFFYKGLTGVFGEKRVTVILTGVGPSRVGDCLGFLALTPARRVLFAGAVGGLAPGQAIGDFFVPTEAADGEGYTRYVGQAFEDVVRSAPRISSPWGMEDPLGAFLQDKGLSVRTGRVFTVGSITFESQENLKTLVRLGYDALEMEISAFYAAAQHHGFEASVLTYISDLPLESPLWQQKTEEEEESLRRAYRALPLLALEWLCSR